MAEKNSLNEKNQFGTFGGVFTPAILTILGVIMFMRANFVVGQAGIIGAITILLIAKSITFTTSFSIAAISTNLRVRGGGSYFLISRVLGAEFGGAIGIALFFALALSVPFYILGFTEALVLSFPALTPHFLVIALTAAVILFTIAFFGAGWAIKTQYVIMSFLFLAIFAFLAGAIQDFSIENFRQNLFPDYTSRNPADTLERSYSYWIIFAIYFPAVTGIDAGVNMSGDLKDPGLSIPKGTFAAVGIGFLVYLLQILLGGGAWSRADLVTKPFDLLQENAIFGWSILVVLGVIAATVSSALGSYLGAPRVLQAVSRDRIIRFLFYFAKGAKKGDEPQRALLLTFAITIAVLLWSGNQPGGAALNAVAAVITMFFLYSYGMINLAAFIEDYGDNPSFRPSFQYFHWSTALVGALGCLTVSFLVNWLAACIAVILIVLMLWYIKTRHLKARFGDARRGFVYQSFRDNLIRLERMAEDPKNWRPNVIVFSGIPESREALTTYALWIAARRGIVYLANVMVGEFSELAPRRAGAMSQLSSFCQEKDIEAFPVVVAADDLEQGVTMLLQATTIGPVHPNLAIFGLTKQHQNLSSFLNQLQTAQTLGKSILLLSGDHLPHPNPNFDKRIDIWWRGQKNGDLMILVAYLLTENWEWGNAKIRILRMVENEKGREPAQEALKELIELARVEAIPQIIVSKEPFEDVLSIYSHDATCTILGFEIPEAGDEDGWHNTCQRIMKKIPTVIMVNSQGGEKLLT